MRLKSALLFYYTKLNKYSFNILLGALEEEELLEKIKIYFANSQKELFFLIDSLLLKYKKIILCFSFFTTQIWKIKEIIHRLKKKYSNKILYIAGGPHPTGAPFKTLEMGFDIVVTGEGEETFKELLSKIIENQDIKDVKGIAFKDEKKGFILTPKREFLDLNKYPPFSLKYNKFNPIEITRGCSFGCHFCQTSYLFGKTLRHRSLDNICRYVEIMKKLNLLDIRFITPNAFSYGSSDGKNLNIKKLEELLSRIRKIIGQRGRIFIGSFPSEIRPEHVTEETLSLILKYANNDNITIGAQSGSQKVLDLINRSHTVEDVYRAVKLSLKAGLKVNVDFIFGLPYETKKDIIITLKVIKDLVKMGAKIHAHSFLPLPQTPLFKSEFRPIDERLKKWIGRLTSKGLIFGNWLYQSRLSQKIKEYFRE